MNSDELHLRSSCGTSDTKKAEHNDDIIIRKKSKQSRCPCAEALSFTQGHLYICNEPETAKNSHLQNVHKKKKRKTIKLYETHKGNRSIFKKKRRILYVLYMPPLL